MLHRLQSCVKNWTLGVFAADQIPININKFPCGFIANSDDHLKEGRYWCSFYFPNSSTVEYFDSYGKPYNYFNSYFPKYVSNFTTVIVNSYSDVCGMYCLQRINGVSFS